MLDALGSPGRVNASASDGELSITLDNPTSRWIHLLVHAASACNGWEGAESATCAHMAAASLYCPLLLLA